MDLAKEDSFFFLNSEGRNTNEKDKMVTRDTTSKHF